MNNHIIKTGTDFTVLPEGLTSVGGKPFPKEAQAVAKTSFGFHVIPKDNQERKALAQKLRKVIDSGQILTLEGEGGEIEFQEIPSKRTPEIIHLKCDEPGLVDINDVFKMTPEQRREAFGGPMFPDSEEVKAEKEKFYKSLSPEEFRKLHSGDFENPCK